MKGLATDLARLVSGVRVRADTEDLFSYSSDATRYFVSHMPDAVVLPDTTEQVSKVVRYAFDHDIPLTPRGAGSGLSAGCTPIRGGIVLDMKRMRRIVDINRGNMTATVEAGVVLSAFHRAVEKQRLFYPPDPQSMDVCTIGGNVATQAGGPHGVKYGTTKNYVLGLEVVLPDGEVINTGGVCVKQSTGYDLTHLLTGSEGTLGVITRANLRLLPLPPSHRTVVVICKTVDQAAEMVSEIIAAGTVPARLEYLPQGAIALMNQFISPPLTMDGQACLLMDIDGSKTQIEEDSSEIRALSNSMGAMDVRVIEDEKEAETYWKARRNLHSSILAVFRRAIVEDVTVPRNRIPEFVRAVQDISASLGTFIGMGGHAGDGNVHPNIILDEITEETEKKAQVAVERIIRAGLELGGTISGEHGIGLHKARFLAWELGEAQIELLKRVKAAFDPKGIMNPGKIWEHGG